jgi:hypothetical protein
MSRKKVVIGVVVLAVAAFAGGAYAATQSNTNPRQAFLDDVAKRLNVTPAQLSAAFRAAYLDRLAAAVKAGAITQAQADKLKQRLDQGAPVPFLYRPPGLEGPRFAVPPGFGGPPGFEVPRGLARRVFVRPSTIGAAATYLGIGQAQLLTDLRQGQTLAQIAKARGKSVAGLQQAITAAIKARLDRAVANGRITKVQEDKVLSRLQARIENRLGRRLLLLPPRFRVVPPGKGPWGSGPPPGKGPWGSGPPPGKGPWGSGPPPGPAGLVPPAMPAPPAA